MLNIPEAKSLQTTLSISFTKILRFGTAESQVWTPWTASMNPLDSKEIKQVDPKGDQSWIVIGRTDAKAPILWLPDTKNQLIRKDPDAGKDLRQKGKGTTEDEMAGWHHWYNEHELGQTPGDGERQRNLVCVSPWGCEESDTTRWLNSNNKVEQQQQSMNIFRGSCLAANLPSRSMIPFFTPTHFPAHSQIQVLELCFNWHQFDSKKWHHFPTMSYWRENSSRLPTPCTCPLWPMCSHFSN